MRGGAPTWHPGDKERKLSQDDRHTVQKWLLFRRTLQCCIMRKYPRLNTRQSSCIKADSARSDVTVMALSWAAVLGELTPFPSKTVAKPTAPMGQGINVMRVL